MKTQVEIAEARQLLKDKFDKHYKILNAGLATEEYQKKTQILGVSVMALCWVMGDDAGVESEFAAEFDEVVGTAALEAMGRKG